MYGQGNPLQSSLLGGQRNMAGDPASNLSDEEKRFFEELIRKELEKQQGGGPSMPGSFSPYGG
jgi:hypothetical protein